MARWTLSLRRKTIRRLAILAAVAAALGGAAELVFHQRQARRERWLADLRDRGIRAYTSGDYAQAADWLDHYMSLHESDDAAILAYAISKSRASSGGYQNLQSAQARIELALRTRPYDVAIKHALLEITPASGDLATMERISDEVLAQNPDDPLALEARVTTRLRQSRFEDALTAARQRSTVRPGDLDARLAAMQLMMRQHKPAAEVMDYASAFDLGPANSSAANLLLRAIATDYAGRRDDALARLHEAANCPVTDVAVVGQIVNLFDAFKHFDEAETYLRAAVTRGNSADLHRALAIRMWQEAKYAEIPLALPNDVGADSTDSAVLALRVAALHEIGDAKAPATLAALKARTDRVASAWTTAIVAHYDARLIPAEKARQLSKALSRDPDNGIIRAWLGDCYASAGEWTLAARSYAAAASQLPGWATPCVKWCDVLLQQHRAPAAVAAMSSAFDRSPTGPLAVRLARVRWTALNAVARDADEERALLAFVDRYANAETAIGLLPVRVALLARGGKTAAAQPLFDAAIKSPATLDAETALALADAARGEGLTGADDALAAVPPAKCTPALQLARAEALAEQNQLAKAYEAISSVTGSDIAAWRLAYCRFLARVDPAKAAEASRRAAIDFPDSAVVQNATCGDAIARGDTDVALKTLDRLRTLTGDAGAQWRMHRARMLVSRVSTPLPGERDTTAEAPDAAQISDGVEAVSVLTDIVREAPTWIAPRLQLASALAGTGNGASAVEHLKAAAAIDPSSAETTLALVALLREQDRGDEIGRALRNFAPPAVLADGQRIQLAAAMADAGLSANAAALLASARHSLPSTGRLLLAEQYRQAGDLNSAVAVYDLLLADEKPSPAALASATEFYATHGNIDLARRTLRRLSTSGASAVDVAVASGRYEERFGSEADALTQFKAAAASANEIGSVALIDYYLRHGRTAEAAAAAKHAVSRFARSRVLADRLIEAEAAVARGVKPGDLTALINALSHDSSRVAEVATLKSLADLGQTQAPAAAFAHRLSRIAAAFPADLPLAQQAVAFCVRQGDSDSAIVVARQTQAALPSEAGAARLTVEALRAGRRWSEMLAATDVWQARAGAITIDIATARGEALLGQNDTAAALALMQAYREKIAADARSQPQAATVLARALLGSGKHREALTLVGPLFRDAVGRRSGRELSRYAAPTLESALAAADAVASVTPSTAWEEQNDQAALLADLGRKFDDRAVLDRAIAKYQDYLKASPSDADAMLDLAGLEVQTGRAADAEKRLRELLVIEPNHAAAKNDLACILMSNESRLDEAERLSRAAVATAPSSAVYQDTLARVLLASGRPNDARTCFQTALRLDPNLVPARVGLARLMRDQGDTSAARTELRRVDGTLRANPRAGAYVSDELSTLRAELTQLDP